MASWLLVVCALEVIRACFSPTEKFPLEFCVLLIFLIGSGEVMTVYIVYLAPDIFKNEAKHYK